MDAIINYITNNILAIIAIVIAIIALFQNRKSDKSQIKQEIAKKQAELKTLNDMHFFCDGSSMGNAMVRKSVLQSEIEELKKML